MTYRTAILLAIFLGLSGCDDAPSHKSTHDADFPAPAGMIESVASWGTAAKAEIDTAHLLTDNWYIVIDGSGSMGSDECSSGHPGGRMTDAKDAMKVFVSHLPSSTANIGLYVFDNHDWGERVPLGHGQVNRDALGRAIAAVSSGGGTPLVPSITAAYKALKAQAARQAGYGSYHIVVETDGEPNVGGGIGELSTVIDQVTQAPIIIETIGFCLDESNPLKNGGRTVYRDARNPAQLSRGLSEILAEVDNFDNKEPK